MATPQDDNYLAASGVTINIGRFGDVVESLEDTLFSLLPTFYDIGDYPTFSNTYLDFSDRGSERPEIGIAYEPVAIIGAKRQNPSDETYCNTLRSHIIECANNALVIPWGDKDAMQAYSTWPGGDISANYTHFPNIFFPAALITTSKSERDNFIHALVGKFVAANAFENIGSLTDYYHSLQERGWGWGMRERAQLAWLEGQGLIPQISVGTYGLSATTFRDALDADIAHALDWQTTTYVEKLYIVGSEAWRFMDGRSGTPDWTTSAWMEAFCGESLSYAYRMGFTGWLPVMQWHMNYYNKKLSDWDWQAMDSDKTKFNDSYDEFLLLSPAEQDAYDPYLNMPLDKQMTDDSESPDRANALINSGWDSSLLVDTNIDGVLMTYSNRWDEQCAAMAGFAEAGVSGASTLLQQMINQRQARLDRGGATDVEWYRNSTFGWRNITPQPIGEPSWLNGLNALEWSEVGQNTLSDLDPENDVNLNPNYPVESPWRGTNGQAAVMKNWGGAQYLPGVGLFIWGGGHQNYAGNELYIWREATGQFERLTNPTGAIGNAGQLDDGNESSGVYFDGQPRSYHTYNNFAVRDGVLWCFGGSTYKSGVFVSRPFYYDVNANEWVMDADVNCFAGSGSVCYDSLRDRFVIVRNGNNVIRTYDPNSNTVTNQLSSDSTLENYSFYHTESDSVIYLNGADEIRLIPADFSSASTVCTETNKPFGDMDTRGTVYDEASSRLYTRGNSSEVWFCDVPNDPTAQSFVWQQLTTTGSITTSPQASGTYGRFFVGGYNYIGVIDDVTANMNILRLQ